MRAARRADRGAFAKENGPRKARERADRRLSRVPLDPLPSLRDRREGSAAFAGKGGGESQGGIDSEKESIAFEPNAKKRAMRRRSAAKVVTPTKDASIGKREEMPVEYQLETAGVAVLVLLFLVIILGGIFLGASAFLSEDLDRLAQELVYPNYSKVVVAFLLGSTAYGFYKSR